MNYLEAFLKQHEHGSAEPAPERAGQEPTELPKAPLVSFVRDPTPRAELQSGPARVLDHGLAVREVLGFPAALLPELPLSVALVVELSNGRRLTWGMHHGRGRADRNRGEWLALCGPDRCRTVRAVMGELGATLRAVVIEGGEP